MLWVINNLLLNHVELPHVFDIAVHLVNLVGWIVKVFFWYTFWVGGEVDKAGIDWTSLQGSLICIRAVLLRDDSSLGGQTDGMTTDVCQLIHCRDINLLPVIIWLHNYSRGDQIIFMSRALSRSCHELAPALLSPLVTRCGLIMGN